MHSTQTVITLVSALGTSLTDDKIRRILLAVKNCGAADIATPSWLDPHRAVDFVLSEYHPQLLSLIRQKLDLLPDMDIFVQPLNEIRRKRLFIADMDATIVVGETIDEIAAHFGLKDQIAPITQRAMNGEIDFTQALQARVRLLRGKKLEDLHNIVMQMRFAAGAEILINTLRRFDTRCVLVSGGFDLFTSAARNALGFDKDISNHLLTENDLLIGDVKMPIVDQNSKRKALEDECKNLHLSPLHAMAVGDGANDIAMLQTAGVGVGYYAKPAVIAAVPHQIKCTDLTSLLFMQGYRRSEFWST